MKTYYITGISGFLGVNIANELIKSEDVIINGLVLPNEKCDLLPKSPNIHLYKGNILNIDDIDNFLDMKSSGERIVIHLAGYISLYKRFDKLCMNINYNGTKNMVDLSIKHNIDKFLFVSSVDSIKKTRGNDYIYEPDSYSIYDVDGVYSKSKVLANNYLLSHKDELNSTILLPSVFIGPNDPYSAPMNDAIRKFLNGKLNTIVKGGYDISDVRDVAKGIISASFIRKSGESYLLTGDYYTMKEFLDKVAFITSKKKVNTFIPLFIAKMVSPFIEIVARIRKRKPLFTAFSMDCLKQNSHYRSDKAERELNYKKTPLDKSLKDTIEWMYKSNYLDK